MRYIIIAILFAATVACSEQKSPSIAGEWIGTTYSFDETSNGDHSNVMNSGLKLHTDSYLNLKEDGTYLILDSKRQTTSEGTWWREKDSLYILAAIDTFSYGIKTITDTELSTVHEVNIESPVDTIKGKITLVYERFLNDQ